eukprot:g10476.t1
MQRRGSSFQDAVGEWEAANLYGKVLEGGDAAWSEKSDMYQLGIVVYEMCTLRLPYDADNMGALTLQIAAGLEPAAVVRQAPTSPPSASAAASTAKKATTKSGIPKVFLQISPSSEGFHYKYHVKRRLGKDWKYVHWNDRKCLEFIVKTPLPGLFEEARREASAMEFPAMVEKYGVAGENDYKASRVYQLVQFFLREKFIQGAHGADFCRMYFLYVHGGVYMDTDMMLYTDVWESAAAAASGNEDPENANPGMIQQVQEGGIEAILGDSETGLVISDLYGRGNYVKLRMSFGLQDSADADLSDSAFFRQHLSCAAAEATNLNMTGIDHCSDVLPLLQAPQFPDVTNATLIDLGFIATVPRHPVILEALHDLYRTRRSVLEDPTRNYWVFCTRMWHSVTRFQKFVGVGRSNLWGQEELEPVQDEGRAAVQRQRPRVDESIPFLPQPWHNERILDFDSESDLKYTRRNNYVVEDIPIYLLNLRFRNLSEVDYIFRDFGVPDLAVADSKKTSGNVRKNAVVMNAEDIVMEETAARQDAQIDVGHQSSSDHEVVDEDSPRATVSQHHNANFYHAGRQHPDKVPDHVPGDHASGFFSYVKHVEGLGSRTKVKILPMREVGTVSCGDTVLGPAMGRVLGRNCNTYFVDVDDSTGLPHDKSKGGERAVLKHFHRTKAIPDHELRKPLTNVFTYAWSNKSAFDRETALMHG